MQLGEDHGVGVSSVAMSSSSSPSRIGVILDSILVMSSSVLAQVRVLAPAAPLSKIAEEADSQEYIDAIERMEPEVEDLASRIVDNLNIVISPPDDEA